MTVMPVPVAPPEVPAAEPSARPPAPGFDHALAHAQRDDDATRRPDRDSTPKPDQPAKNDKPAKNEKPDKADKSDDKDAANATPTDAATATTAPTGLPDKTLVALLAALTGIVGKAEPGEATGTAPAAPPTAGNSNATTEAASATAAPAVDTTHDAPATTPAPAPAPHAATTEADKHAPAPVAAPEPANASATDAAIAAVAESAARPTPPVAAPRPAPALAPVTNTALAVPPPESRVEIATTEAVGTVAATTPAPPPPPADQLFAGMRPLQRNADGSYQIRIELRPPELGRVDMRVELRDGVLHASIHAEHAHTVEIMRNALDDLRARLDADGVRAGELTVDDGRAGTRDRQQERAASDAGADDKAAVAVPGANLAATRSPNPDALLDVRI